MESSQAFAFRSKQGRDCAINVGDTERTISLVAGGFVLLHGLSKLSLSTIVAAVAGGALVYRGLTGHCSAYQALEMSTACGLGNNETGGQRSRSLPDVTEASLAAAGESPPVCR